MKKYFILIVTVLLVGLLGCSKGKIENQASENPSESTISKCAEPMDITAENLLNNIDKGLKETDTSSDVINKSIEKNDCGNSIQMDTKFGTIIINVDNNNTVLSYGAGFEKTEDVTNNTINTMHIIQVMTSYFSTEPFGKTDIGKSLFEKIGQSFEQKKPIDFEYKDLIYTVTVDNARVAIVARKIF